jgi:phosphate-selective porin OprO/OprP
MGRGRDRDEVPGGADYGNAESQRDCAGAESRELFVGAANIMSVAAAGKSRMICGFERLSRLRRRAMAAWLLVSVVGLAGATVARGDEQGLLEMLQEKHVLTPQEVERVKGRPITPEQQRNLIDVLREKGVLTQEEASKLTTAPPQKLAVAAPPPEKPAVTPQIGYKDGVFLRTADGNFTLRFNGRVSSNFFFFEPGTTQTNTATIDRARLGFDATVYKYFMMRLENDFTSSSGLRDAYIGIRPLPEFNQQLGQFKVPFSYEELRSKRYIDFVERAAVVNDAVNPSRDIGVMAHGRLGAGLLQYQFAAMNGAGQNQSDNNSDKDFIGRLVVTPFGDGSPEYLRGLNFGGAVTWGREPAQTTTAADGSTSFTKNSIKGVTETGFTFFPAVATSGDRLRLDTHVAWLDGPYSFSSEYIQTQQARDGLGPEGSDLPDLDTDGAYVGGTWMITGETKPFNSRVYPTRPLWNPEKPGWGAWEAAVRYEYFSLRHGPDSPTDTLTHNRYDAVEVGLNWYPNEFLRFSLNYLYGHFAEKGTNLSPDPDKHSNNAVLGRAQLEF